MQEDGVDGYHIVPSMHDRDTYFLFCPGELEKKFGLTQSGQITEHVDNPLWKTERMAIRRNFGIKDQN